MATVDRNLKLEVAHFSNFKEHIKWKDYVCMNTVEHLLKEGLLEISTLFEKAISQCGRIKMVSEEGRDFADNSDAKLSCVRTSSNGKSYSAPVCKIHTKQGFLRVQVYERKQNKFYYFLIPNEAYKDIPPKSNIEIPFELNGDPRRVPMRPRKYANWWDYEVPTFKAMAKRAR